MLVGSLIGTMVGSLVGRSVGRLAVSFFRSLVSCSAVLKSKTSHMTCSYTGQSENKFTWPVTS